MHIEFIQVIAAIQHRASLLHIREEGWPRYEEGGHNAGKRMTMTADEETRGWVDFSLIGNVNFNRTSY